MKYEHAALGSNKIFNVALRRNCFPAPGLYQFTEDCGKLRQQEQVFLNFSAEPWR